VPHCHRLSAAAALAAVALFQPVCLRPAAAQSATGQSPNWFVPGQPKPAAGAAPAAPRTVARPTPRPQPVPAPAEQQGAEQDAPPPPPNIQLPPVPELPALPKGVTPPAAVIGVLGVPEVMHASTAAQAVEKVIGERREKLNQDAQKEQATWRDMQQSLASQRASLSPDQIRAKERELQERITSAQRQFRDRNRIIQEAAQVALGQIERTLIAVIRQVAESRGMNLVLHRAQVALNINEFDITDQVAEQINKVLPTVGISPDGQEPTAANLAPIPVAQAAPAATPAVTPAATAPAPEAAAQPPKKK